jgi:hypothetical protein
MGKQSIGVHATVKSRQEIRNGVDVSHVRAQCVFVGPDAQKRAETWAKTWEEGCRGIFVPVQVEVEE